MLKLFAAATSHKVKRALDSPTDRIRKLDVNGGETQRFMTKQRFDGKQIRAIFIKVCGKGMSESMRSDPVFPAKKFFMVSDIRREVLATDGHTAVPDKCGMGREQPVCWFATGKPVFGEDVKRLSGKNGITVRPGF